MSRQFKFRTWDEELKIMTYMNNWNQITSWKSSMYEENEVMQFTGMVDRNGIKIFEGDIVKAKKYEPNIYQIKFIEGGYCLTNPRFERYPLDINTLYPSYGCQIEVIGNIYENPELLED